MMRHEKRQTKPIELCIKLILYCRASKSMKYNPLNLMGIPRIRLTRFL